MSECKKCFEKYQQDGVLVIEELREPFENYSAGNFGDGDTSYTDNYLKALNAIYHQNDIYMSDDDEEDYGSYWDDEDDIVENFSPQVDFAAQNALFNSGDYVDYYHNLFSNV